MFIEHLSASCYTDIAGVQREACGFLVDLYLYGLAQQGVLCCAVHVCVCACVRVCVCVSRGLYMVFVLGPGGS